MVLGFQPGLCPELRRHEIHHQGTKNTKGHQGRANHGGKERGTL
jgi:hypothetical protein